MTAASKLVGVATGTGIAWAAQHGFEASRRPKSVSVALQTRIADQLACGDDKAEISRRHGVSMQAVTRVLRAVPGLAELRRLAAHGRRQLAAREAWILALATWPGASVGDLRERAGGAYAWLRRHEPEWLDTHMPQPPSKRPFSARVDWDQRDAELAAAVRRAAADLAGNCAAAPLRLWQLCQALPELKAKLGALDRLPLSARALDEVTRRRARKIQQLI